MRNKVIRGEEKFREKVKRIKREFDCEIVFIILKFIEGYTIY